MAAAAPQPSKRKMVVLEEGTITAMASNAAILKAFPFLSRISSLAKAKGCGSCGAAAQKRAAAFQQVKRDLAGLASDRKRVLKDLLNTERARVLFRAPNGKAQELTF